MTQKTSDASPAAIRDALSGGKKSIARQIVLPWGKSFRISFNNLRIRFFRSLITASSLVLAVSFLSFVLVNLDIARGFLANQGAAGIKILLEAGYDVDPKNLTVAASAKEHWIVLLSLLVCTVGIINAQLMSVTERFREIGIMKCLGALDSIVLRLFLLEAAMQGFAGAAVGALLGFAFAMIGGLIRFGFAAWGDISYLDAGLSMLIATAAGLALSLLGVLYPAIVAAKMRPVLAMKAEH